jgi:hypothetical protein
LLRGGRGAEDRGVSWRRRGPTSSRVPLRHPARPGALSHAERRRLPQSNPAGSRATTKIPRWSWSQATGERSREKRPALRSNRLPRSALPRRVARALACYRCSAGSSSGRRTSPTTSLLLRTDSREFFDLGRDVVLSENRGRNARADPCEGAVKVAPPLGRVSGTGSPHHAAPTPSRSAENRGLGPWAFNRPGRTRTSVAGAVALDCDERGPPR